MNVVCLLTHVPEPGEVVHQGRAVKECLLPGHGPLWMILAHLLYSARNVKEVLTGERIVAERERVVGYNGD